MRKMQNPLRNQYPIYWFILGEARPILMSEVFIHFFFPISEETLHLSSLHHPFLWLTDGVTHIL